MAAGSTVLAVDTVFNREVMSTVGQFCKLDPVEISRQISTILDLPIVRPNSAAISRAREHYSWDSVCADYVKILLSVL
jgi:glycosyltransferase involved in cell wall biosynthesis